jgi:hypothetical protein
MRIRPAQQSFRGSAKDDTDGYDLLPRMGFVRDARLFVGFRFGARLAATAR